MAESTLATVQGQSRVKYESATVPVQGQSRVIVGPPIQGQSRVVVGPPPVPQGQSRVVIVQPSIPTQNVIIQPAEVSMSQPIQLVHHQQVIPQQSYLINAHHQAHFPSPLAASQISTVSRTEIPRVVQGGVVQIEGPMVFPQQAFPQHQYTIYQPQYNDQVMMAQEQIYRAIQSPPQQVLYNSRIPQQHIIYQSVQPVEQQPIYYSDVGIPQAQRSQPVAVRGQSPPTNSRYATAAEKYISSLERQNSRS